MDSHAVRYAASLSLIEVGLGSFLHAFRIPLRGQILSLNQGFLLSRASFTGVRTRREGARLTHLISQTVACLKSLSPAGQRLTPMVAISVQGSLFSFAQLIGGVSMPGHVLGAWLVSLWALLQPILLGWLLNGDDFLLAIEWTIQKLSPSYGWWIAGGFVALNLILGFFLTIVSKRMSAESWERYQARMVEFAKSPGRTRHPWLPSPIFFASIGMTVAFLYFTESPHARSIWVWLRPLGLTALFLFAMHWTPVEKIVRRLESRSPMLAETLKAVRAKLTSRADSSAHPNRSSRI